MVSDTPIAMDDGEAVERLVATLRRLRSSGHNWQIVLHGGRGGDVRMESTLYEDLIRLPAKDAARSGR